MAKPLQEFIHKLELGSGRRWLSYLAGVLGMAALASFYNLFCFYNLNSPEGMDYAQLARNVARGEGFTTDLIRPFSIYLLRRHQWEKLHRDDPQVISQTNLLVELRRMELPGYRNRHPDLAHAPIYPFLLAGWLSVWPGALEQEPTNPRSGLWVPDVWITLLNQLCFAFTTCLLFRLARKLFDDRVAWLTAAVFFGTELFWRFSASGLPTLLLMAVFIGLTGLLARMDRLARFRKPGDSVAKPFLVAALAGLLAGVGGLIQYAFALLIIPVALWIILLPIHRRLALAGTAVGVCLVVMAPWVARNAALSGTPFGTAGFAIYEDTGQFPADELMRSIEPNFAGLQAGDLWRKLWVNSTDLLVNELPRYGGSWVAAFFLVGLLVPYRNPALNRLKLFVVLALATLAVAQALTRTHFSTLTAGITSDNLLVIAAPMVFLGGVSLFANLAARFTLPGLKQAATGTFCLIAFAPLILGFLTPQGVAYVPQRVQEKTALLEADALVASDVPWAVAWHGYRRSVWLPLEHRAHPNNLYRNDFYAVHDGFEPCSALYLAGETLSRLSPRAAALWRELESEDRDWDKMVELTTTLSHWMADQPEGEQAVARLRQIIRLVEQHWVVGGDQDWTSFLLSVYINHEVPTGFPLRQAPLGLLPEVFLMKVEQSPAPTIQSMESTSQ